jgi:hypothetical protein
MRHMYLIGDYSAASSLADEYRRCCIVDPIFRAFDATLDVLDLRSDIAKEKFVDLIEGLKDRPRKDNPRRGSPSWYGLQHHNLAAHSPLPAGIATRWQKLSYQSWVFDVRSEWKTGICGPRRRRLEQPL